MQQVLQLVNIGMKHANIRTDLTNRVSEVDAVLAEQLVKSDTTITREACTHNVLIRNFWRTARENNLFRLTFSDHLHDFTRCSADPYS